MTSDARISAGLPDHPKTKKLIRKLGQAAAWNLVRLILWTAANRSDGDLSNLSTEDIELSADWTGEPGAFVTALVSLRFMDGDENEYQLHDWSEHNPWAAGAEQRSSKARWNAVCRHHGPSEADRLVPEYAAVRAGGVATSNPASTATSNPASSPDSNADCNTVDANSTATSNAPSPSPSPSPSQRKPKSPPVGGSPGFDAFWRAWPSHHRKESRGKCFDSWKRAQAEPLTAQIVAHVEALKRSEGWTKDGGQFIPAPLVYLNNRRWEGAENAADAASAARRLVL